MVHCFRKKSSFLHNQSWHTCEIFRFCVVLFLVRWFGEKLRDLDMVCVDTYK